MHDLVRRLMSLEAFSKEDTYIRKWEFYVRRLSLHG
jgi:hypothetical protein